jgi:hypothetical protein
MSHRTVIINSVVVPAAPGVDDLHPEVEVSVTYRPSDGTSPQECGKMVTRIIKRLQGLADTQSDE